MHSPLPDSDHAAPGREIGQNVCSMWSVRDCPVPVAADGVGELRGPSRGHEEQPSNPWGCGEPRSALGQWQCGQHWAGRVAHVLLGEPFGSAQPRAAEGEAGGGLGWRVMEGGSCHGGDQGHEGLQGCKFRVKLEMWEVVHCGTLKALQMAEVRNEEGPRILWRRGQQNWGLNIVGAGSCGTTVVFDGL